MSVSPRKAAVILAAACTTLFAAACAGQSGSGATDDASKQTMITFWHGWSEPSEVKAVTDEVKAFEKARRTST